MFILLLWAILAMALISLPVSISEWEWFDSAIGWHFSQGIVFDIVIIVAAVVLLRVYRKELL